MATYNDTNQLSLRYADWADTDKKEVYKSIFAQIKEYDQQLSPMVQASTLRGIKAYTGRGVTSIHSNLYTGYGDADNQLGSPFNVNSRINFNITAALIDTLSAKLASLNAVPQAVTNKGNSKGRKLAEDVNDNIKGVFHKHNVSHLINLAYKDAMISRVGYLKVVHDNGDIRIDRVYADEVLIDTSDGYYNNPYKMIHRKSIPVHVLLNKYPKFKTQIMSCQLLDTRKFNSYNNTPSIMVAEAWCKNTYLEKGRHVISVENADLLDEEWDKDYFPILKCDYSEPVIGYVGQSLVDELDPIQREIDRVLVTMQAIMRIVSIPRVFVDTNSQLNKQHMTNKVGLMLEYDAKQGVAPIIHNGAAMPPELPQHIQFLIEQAYARVGLTPMDSQGQQKTGSGNQSGEALKTMTEIKSERWQLLQHNYEQSHVQLADIILSELQGTNIKMSVLDRHIGLKQVSTKSLPKTKDSYVLQVFPVSSLPDSIPDLIDSVQQMLQLGVIQPAQVPDLFNMPDLDAFVSLQSAPRKLIDKKIEEMMDGGKYWNPEPYHDLDYALGTALQHYSWGQLNDASEKELKLMRRFINDIKSLMAQRMAAQQPPMQGVSANGQQPTTPGQPAASGSPQAGGQPPPGTVPTGS